MVRAFLIFDLCMHRGRSAIHFYEEKNVDQRSKKYHKLPLSPARVRREAHPPGETARLRFVFFGLRSVGAVPCDCPAGNTRYSRKDTDRPTICLLSRFCKPQVPQAASLCLTFSYKPAACGTSLSARRDRTRERAGFCEDDRRPVCTDHELPSAHSTRPQTKPAPTSEVCLM